MVCFHVRWAVLARRAREFTWSGVRLGTVPRGVRFEGEKQWRRVGLAGSTRVLLVVVMNCLLSLSSVRGNEGRSTRFEMSGTRSKSPSRASFRSRHKCHSLETKWTESTRRTDVVTRSVEINRVTSGLVVAAIFWSSVKNSWKASLAMASWMNEDGEDVGLPPLA